MPLTKDNIITKCAFSCACLLAALRYFISLELFLSGFVVTFVVILETLRSDNGDGNGNVRSLGRAGLRPVGVPAKIEITNFTSENVDDGH